MDTKETCSVVNELTAALEKEKAARQDDALAEEATLAMVRTTALNLFQYVVSGCIYPTSLVLPTRWHWQDDRQRRELELLAHVVEEELETVWFEKLVEFRKQLGMDYRGSEFAQEFGEKSVTRAKLTESKEDERHDGDESDHSSAESKQ